MWNRKDFVAAAVAAVATFALTMGLFSTREATATDDKPVTTVMSPVLHVGACEVTAQADGVVPAMPANAKNANMPGVLNIEAGAVPKIRLLVKNTSEVEATVAFTGTLQTSAGAGMSRVIPVPKTNWTAPFNMVLKPGETREIEVDTKASVGAMSQAYLSLKTDADPKTPVSALTFIVSGNLTGKRVTINAAKRAEIAPDSRQSTLAH